MPADRPPAAVVADPQGPSSTPPSTNPPLPPPEVGGTPWFTVTVDVGAQPTPSASGTFPHAGMAVGTRIIASLSAIYPPSKNADEWEMSDVGVRMLVRVPDVVTYVLVGRDGYLSGEYNIDYIIGG